MDRVSPNTSGPHKLIALAPGLQPPEYLLIADYCSIGRSAGNDIVIAHLGVSRTHAGVARESQQWVLHDRASANGTYVNGQRLYQPHTLRDNDIIGLAGPAPLLRYIQSQPSSQCWSGIHYDERTATFFYHHSPVRLTPNQFRLLLHLYHSGQPGTRESCAQALWGRPYDPTTDAAPLDRALANLRQRLQELTPAITLHLAWN